MRPFTGLKKSCRKLNIAMGVPPAPRRGLFDLDDTSDSDSDDSDIDGEGGAASDTTETTAALSGSSSQPLGTAFAAASDMKPAGITFGSSWQAHSAMPIFTRRPKFPTTMQPHNKDGLEAAITGIETCKTIITESSERDPQNFFIPRSAGDERPYEEIKAEHMNSLVGMWVPQTVMDVPPGFNPVITEFPQTTRGANPMDVAIARASEEAPAVPQRMHLGTAAQRPKPETKAVKGSVVIVMYKEDEDEEAAPAVARVVDVIEGGDVDDLKLRWYNDPNSTGKCTHFAYDRSQLFSPPVVKVVHCANNLATASGTARTFLQLSEVGKKWWSLAIDLCK
jgi:hypothetical protein